MMAKRGIGHIEFVLSFILFVSAVGFALYFFNPGDSTRLVGSSLDYLFEELEENATITLQVFSVRIFPDNILDKLGKISMNFTNVDETLGVLVQDLEGNKFNAERVGVNVEVTPPQGGSWEGVGFLQVKFSDGIETYDGGTASGGEDIQYQITSSNVRYVLSEKYVNELVEKYNNDYEKFKEELNIPPKVDFDFGLYYVDEKIEVESKTPEGFQIFAETKRREVLTSEGDNAFGEFVVRAW